MKLYMKLFLSYKEGELCCTVATFYLPEISAGTFKEGFAEGHNKTKEGANL